MPATLLSARPPDLPGRATHPTWTWPGDEEWMAELVGVTQTNTGSRQPADWQTGALTKPTGQYRNLHQYSSPADPILGSHVWGIVGGRSSFHPPRHGMAW